MATAVKMIDDVVRVLAGEPTRAQVWAKVRTQADARKAARTLGVTQAQAIEAFKRRQERAANARRQHRDKLSSRRPGWLSDSWARRSLAAAYDACGFRSATHGHETDFSVGGEPGASSSTSQARPSSVGLPNAYSHRGYYVTQSHHAITVAADWLLTVKLRGAAVVDGRLVLQLAAEPGARGRYEATWVEQGRGTALNVRKGRLKLDV